MKKQFIKQLLSILLCVTLMLIYVPLTAFAAGYGDNGYNTTQYSSYTIDGNDILIYVTGSGGTVERISGGDSDSVQQYRAVASDNWEFAYWSTYYYGPTTQSSNPTAVLGYYYFSKPSDDESAYDKTNPVIQVNEEMWAAGVYYLQAIFKPKVTVSVNGELYGSAQSIRGASPATSLDNVFISGNSGYVPFGANVEVSLSAFKEGYIVQSVTVHDGAFRNDFTYQIDAEYNQLKVLFTATRPTNVTINIKLKEQLVAFEANTGVGSMTAQVFDSGVEKALSANTFTKVGYTFDGWNTKADGSGTAYTDGQRVTFTPENDGDTVTLYAQWKECTNHNWENGACAYCGLGCNHSLKWNEPASMNEGNNHWLEIGESCERNCGHKATAKLTLSGTSFTYTGQPITPATITYSDNWQGEKNLQVFYTDNINVGYALAGFSAGGGLGFNIEKATAPNIIFPTVENAITYGQKLKDAKLSSYSNEYGTFNWEAPESVPQSSGNYALDFYPNKLALQNYDWTSLDGNNGTQWIAIRNALCIAPVVVVNKADGTGTVAIDGWTYGEAPNNPIPTSATNGVDNVTYFYKEKGADDSAYTSTVPTQAGKYTLKAVFAENDHYTEFSATVDFEITKATYDMSDAKWDYTNAFLYDGEEYKVEVTGLPNGVTISGYTDNTATNIGKYTAKVTFTYDSNNYNAPFVNDLVWEIKQDWSDTENTEKVKDITVENVTPEDKNDLTKAKADLERALEENGGSYTEEEKKAIEDELKRIDDALEVISNVETVEKLIDKLPETVTKNDEAAIKAADEAYNALADYEKSLVDKDAKKALDDAKAALAKFSNTFVSPATSGNSNLWLWVALLLVSGAALLGITLNERKRKMTTK